MNQTLSSPRSSRPGASWDLKLAAALFIGTCATMSLILPNWHEPLEGTQITRPERYRVLAAPQARAATMADVSDVAKTVSAPPPASPQQQQAAAESYKKGQQQMQSGHYTAAATEFKKALEKSPSYAEAYVGLGDAFTRLGDYRAAETNARHALSQLKFLKTGQAPDLHLKKELSYAHQVLGIALLHLAKTDLDNHDMSAGKMKALEAASHCNLAAVFDQADQAAHSCAQQAAALDTHS